MGETNAVESKYLHPRKRESLDSVASTTALVEGGHVKDGVQQVFVQQSVTILAFKDKSPNNTTDPPDLLSPKLFFGFSSEDIPLVLGAVIDQGGNYYDDFDDDVYIQSVTLMKMNLQELFRNYDSRSDFKGAAFVIVSSLMIITVWKCCCRMKISKKKKEYWLNSKGKENSRKNIAHPSVVQSNSVVFLGLKPTQVYDCHKLEKFPEESYPPKPISFPDNEGSGNSNKTMTESLHVVSTPPCADRLVDNLGIQENKRNISSLCGPEYSPSVLQTEGTPQSSVLRREPLQEQVTKGDVLFPYSMNIPSIVVHRDDSMRSSPAFYHRTFYSGTFDQHSLYSCDSQLGSEIDLKNCSLTWSNYSLRPMSTGDCYYDIFQRASFCKKRKNRMRSDIAAAIAMNRSQSSQLNKDTESLVENEVEIVLDERTTL